MKTVGIALLVLASVGLSAAGQILLKYGVRQGAGTIGAMVLAVRAGPAIPAGLLAYACSAVLWLFVLSRIPVSVAYACAALSYVFVAVGAARWFHEPLDAGKMIGISLIMVGVLFVAWQGR